MIKVLEAFDSLEISGGVQAVVMNIFRAMDHEKVHMDFAVYENPKENSYDQEIIHRGGKVIPVSNLSACGFGKFYQQFYNLLKQGNYDIVHAHNIHHNGLILLAAKNADVPIRISHSHQAFDERNTTFLRRMMVACLKIINNRVATRRVACSDLAGKFLYGKRPFEFLPNAVNLERFDIQESKDELREKFGIPKEEKVLVHIGRFSLQKNQFFMIDIMNELRSENCILYMVGDGSLFDEFNNKVKEKQLEEKIKCLGLRNDVPRLLKMADCMLLPSIYEGLPMVAVEAQAIGCFSFLSDVITRQADLGLGLLEYLSIKNASLWAEKIKDFAAGKPIPPSEIKQKMVERKFDVQANLSAWYQLYGVE